MTDFILKEVYGVPPGPHISVEFINKTKDSLSKSSQKKEKFQYQAQ